MSYFLEWLKIDLKANKEYKTNLYSHISLMAINVIITLFSFTVLKKNFDFFLFSQNEIIYFVLQMYFIYLLIASSAMSKRLEYYLLRGDINGFLFKPMNIFKQYFFKTTRTRRFISSGILFIILLFYVLYSKINFLKFLISLSFGLFGGIFYLVIVCFFDSFAFFMKKGNFLHEIFRRMNEVVQYYPYSFMDKFQFSKFLLLLPMLFFGSVTSEYLFGYRSFLELLNLSLFIGILMIIFIFGTYVLWKIGLKRYEGYN